MTEDVAALHRRIAKLERINAALMSQVERTMDQRGSAYSLFQTAITLEGQVRSRTEELTALMRSLERSNQALTAAKEEAERANRSKTRFLAAASHDLLQPLNAARLSISALAEMRMGPEPRIVVGQVERGLQTIEDLIKTLLDISKLDAGLIQPVVRPVRVADVLESIEASFGPLAARKGLRLSVRGGRYWVSSDLVLLQRILQNLVSNAIRYTAAGGVLVAACRRGPRSGSTWSIPARHPGGRAGTDLRGVPSRRARERRRRDRARPRPVDRPALGPGARASLEPRIPGRPRFALQPAPHALRGRAPRPAPRWCRRRASPAPASR